MTDIGFGGSAAKTLALPGAPYIRRLSEKALTGAVALWIAGGGLILFEPSPYEFAFCIVLVLAVVARVKIYRCNLSLLLILLLFVPFSFIAAFQARHVDIAQSFIFAMVTIFMLLTSFFASNYVADQTFRRMRLIMGAYTFIAVVSAVIAILAYLQLMPHAEYFLRYGRAKAMFKDPNVYGPFLIPPAMYALQRLLLGTNARRALFAALVFCALFMGVFASFSRAAWGNFAAAIVIVFFLCFILEAHARDKVRMLLMALVGGMVMIALLLGALSIPAVNALFEVRASAIQNYDTGESGRFGRQGYAYELALAHPWGLGPMEFQSLRIIEAPHNTYVTIIHHNGWGGALCYAALIILTLYRAVRGLGQKQQRLLLIPLVAVYIPLVIQAAIIDIDHWRHYFLVVGLIWGVTAVRADPSVRICRNKALL